MVVSFDAAKFRELILYVSDKSISDPRFGKTKLAKLLFYSDFFAFATLGKPISGAEYAKYPHGPVPRPMNRELRGLEDLGDGLAVTTTYHTKEQIRFVPRRKANLDLFTAAEISLVDDVIHTLRDHDATGVSELSHLEAGWMVTRDYQTIPYETVFISSEPLDPSTVERGRELASQLNLLAGA